MKTTTIALIFVAIVVVAGAGWTVTQTGINNNQGQNVNTSGSQTNTGIVTQGSTQAQILDNRQTQALNQFQSGMLDQSTSAVDVGSVV